MRPPERAEIVIIGSGASGLSAAGALKHVGYQAVALEQDDRIGGSWARRYERLRLHTIRAFSGLAHLAIPRGYPQYVPKDQFARYLQYYAATLGLDVRLGTHVQRVAPDGDSWRIDTGATSLLARVVIFATGRYREPVVPTWSGRDQFQGRLIHSADYRSGAEFAGQRVLVVGVGNSGAEIAADLAEQRAAHVAIAVRTSPPIMPRDLFGIVPAQVLGLLFTPIPAPRALDRGGAVLRRLGTGDLTRYGLEREAWGPFTARRPAVIDVGFVGELKAGRITVRPGIERFTQTGVIFTDGRADTFDAVVAATGYRTALDSVLALPDAIAADGRPRFRSGRQTPFPGLYFIGYDETTRGVLYESNRDSQKLATLVSRYLHSNRA